MPSPSNGPSSAKPSQSSPTSAEQFALAGPSDPPDAHFNAYRPDLADAALAGRVIASHYAEPTERRIKATAALRDRPAADAAIIRSLAAGERFDLLDDTLGWAWGYAGDDRRVGYVETSRISD